MSEPPQWVKDYLHICVAALGLGEIDISIRWVEDLTIEGDACQGFCAPDPMYLRGTIKLDNSLEPDFSGYRIITHEMLHMMQGAQGTVVDRLIALLPKSQRDHALNIWQDATEPTIERTARALTRLLMPKEGGKEKKVSQSQKGVI